MPEIDPDDLYFDQTQNGASVVVQSVRDQSAWLSNTF